jgi:hypothetical protein
MPMLIQNQRLYEDRTVQMWHRHKLPRDYGAIDIDLMGYCAYGLCRDPLYLIESTTNPNKPITVLRRLAERAHVFGLIVQHSEGVIIGGRLVYPQVKALDSDTEVREAIDWIRGQHRCGEEPF